ncbi:hypothetical protein CAPTEDRAFT_201544 [Capitella teleta]|uniref:SGNH domain-containing protein n=1 Tax=Capitella teleta TaxID=283909 RepID=R7U8N1_CAPTE|nr:hypothetical protein CAPTEDRAFT_201544 [Capitella teleta]|eukprot:ELU02730.1 hypothetical protein CAPTEDRAFT_201544 [Capitella teleta]
MQGVKTACAVLALVLVMTSYVLFSSVLSVTTHEAVHVSSQCKVTVRTVSAPPNTLAPCSWKVFRNQYSATGYFPHSGTWEFPSNQTADGSFLPGECSFGPKETFRQKGLQCLRKLNLTKIVTMGDSNGAGYFRALWRFIETFSEHCELVKKEMTEQDFVPDRNYFSRGYDLPAHALNISRRTCRTCVARNEVCTLKSDSGEQHVSVEHLALTGLNDTTLITVPPEQGGLPRVRPTKSTAEFYLKIHLKDEMPDVLILAPPFVHERETSTEDLADLLREFRELIATHVPSTVKVIWIPQMTTWRYSEPIYHNMTANEKNVVFNKELYSQLRSSIRRASSNWFGFYDMQAVTCPLGYMSKDGVHLDPVYYDVMMRHLVMLLCSDI